VTQSPRGEGIREIKRAYYNGFHPPKKGKNEKRIESGILEVTN